MGPRPLCASGDFYFNWYKILTTIYWTPKDLFTRVVGVVGWFGGDDGGCGGDGELTIVFSGVSNWVLFFRAVLCAGFF